MWPWALKILFFSLKKRKYKKIASKKPTRRIESICKRTGVTYVSFHTTRHTYVTRLFEELVDPKTIQKLAGHENIMTTLNIYTHTNQERKEEAVEKLAAVL